MSISRISESGYRLCLLVWENEPIKAADLAKMCKERLCWSRTTTYTVVKRLCDKNILRMEDSVVTSLVTKNEVQLSEVDEMLDKTFEGSMPAFIAAFAKSRKLSDEKVAELMRLLEEDE